MTETGLELAERVHGEVRRGLAPITDRLDTRERRALTQLIERTLASGPAS